MAKKHKDKSKQPMPGATHGDHPETMSQVRPGPVNDPHNHPVNNIPPPTDDRWAEALSTTNVPGAY